MEQRAIKSHRELEVYQLGFAASMRIFELSKHFPAEERYSLTDQIRRSSRSVCANLAEAWRKRRYEGSFLVKLSDSELEAAETQTWAEKLSSDGEKFSRAPCSPVPLHSLTKPSHY